ncbi:RmlC-like cupin [Stemphylium lycopersici]|nr:RmlC-like cupin [Stemphylium lycopersici]
MSTMFRGLPVIPDEAFTTDAPRKIAKSFLAIEQSEGAGARVRRSVGTPKLRNFSPFLMLDHFAIPPGAGFPDHPHRGQETITYLISGAVDHEDFAGNKGTIETGDLQFMTAGRGIVHAEMPRQNEDGSPNVGMQLWVDLPKELKSCEPRYRDLRAKEIPEATADNGKVHVKVISGQAYGTESLKELAYTPVWLLDFTVQPGGKVKQPLPRGWNAFAYLLNGTTIFSSDGVSRPVEQYHNVVFESNGDSIEASVEEGAEKESRFILVAGLPLDQPIVQYGPFVVTSRDEVMQAMMDYQSHSNGFERANNWENISQSPAMPHSTASQITVNKFEPQPGSTGSAKFSIDNPPPEADASTIIKALYENQVILFKDQQSLSPKAQYELTRLFDPAATGYGHGKTLDAKRSILHPDLKTIPHQPQVQVIGNGPVAEFEGLKNITLKHPHHRTFHREIIRDEDDRENTRFYRWHIDAALYDLDPPKVTSLLAVKVPKTEKMTCRYDDGTGDELKLSRGSTAFVSSYKMYDLLSEKDKEFARTTKVQEKYAPHPYIWMSSARSRSTGLGLLSEDLELPTSQLPPIDSSKIKILPMCWKNPVTGALALQIHPSAIQALHLADGAILDDLKEVREIVYKMQRPGIAPELVYAMDWEEGDLALFHNRGVLHTVTGSFLPDEVRIFRQCNMAASEGVVGPDE